MQQYKNHTIVKAIFFFKLKLVQTHIKKRNVKFNFDIYKPCKF